MWSSSLDQRGSNTFLNASGAGVPQLFLEGPNWRQNWWGTGPNADTSCVVKMPNDPKYLWLTSCVTLCALEWWLDFHFYSSLVVHQLLKMLYNMFYIYPLNTHSCTDGRGYNVTGRPAHHKLCSTYTPKLPMHWWTPIDCNVGFSILAKLLRHSVRGSGGHTPLSLWLVEEPHEGRDDAGLNPWSRWDKVFEVSDFQFNVAVKQDDVCSPWMDKGWKANCPHTWETFVTNCVLAGQILLQGKNPGVVWEYTLPRTERKPDYSWGVVRSDCSAPCAGGETVVLYVGLCMLVLTV